MKNVMMSVVLAVTVLIACTPLKKDSSDEIQTKNIETANKLFESFNKHDWTAMANLYADTAEFIDPSFGQETVKQTRQQTIDKYKQLADLFPDVKDNVVAIYASGEKHVIIEFISSGTAPDSSKWTLPICTVLTIENGMIQKDHTYYDNN